MKMPNMCPFEKKEKEVFFRLPTFFFRNKKILFSFLCIVRQKKFWSDPKIFDFFFLKLLSKFKKNFFGLLRIFFAIQYIKN